MAGKVVTLDALQIQFDVFCKDELLEETIRATINDINEVLRIHLPDSAPQLLIESKKLIATVEPIQQGGDEEEVVV